MTPAIAPVSQPAAATAAPPADEDALDLHLRLVGLFFNRAFGDDPTAVWHAPAPLVLLGGGEGPSLTLATHWRVMVAARARTDTALHLYLLERPEEPVSFEADGPEAEGLPDTARAVDRVARQLRSGGHARPGADLLTYADLPAGVGLAIAPALDAALARALVGVSGEVVATDELLRCLAGPGPVAGLYPASLLGRPGEAMLVTPGANRAPSVVGFEPPAAQLRVVVISLRASTEPRTAPHEPAAPYDPEPADGTRAEEGFALLQGPERAAAGTGLGQLLTASHRQSQRSREPAEADQVVDLARAAGAFGARATSPTSALAIVPTGAVRQVRAAVTDFFVARGDAAPRFLTTAGFARVGA